MGNYLTRFKTGAFFPNFCIAVVILLSEGALGQTGFSDPGDPWQSESELWMDANAITIFSQAVISCNHKEFLGCLGRPPAA